MKRILSLLVLLPLMGAICNDGIRTAPPAEPEPAPINPAYFEKGFKTKYSRACADEMFFFINRLKTASTKIEEVSRTETPYDFSHVRCQGQVYIPDFELNAYIFIFENADFLVEVDKAEIFTEYGHYLRNNYAQDSNAMLLIDNDSVWGDNPKESPEGLLVIQEAFVDAIAKRD